MPFVPVSCECLDQFHQAFQGDTESTFPFCLTCGGSCEYTAITCLLKGEAEYIASKRGESLDYFRNKYLDGVLVDGEVVDLIKCTEQCPLLDPVRHSCQLRGHKPVLCLIYPLVFKPENGTWKYFIDQDCPIAHEEKSRSYFLTEGIRMAEKLLTDDRWLRCTYIFDQFDFDYRKMEKIRNWPVDQYRLFTLDEILSCRREPGK